MPIPLSTECLRYFRRKNFGALYIAITLLSLHWAIVLYINSSYLANFLSSEAIGTVYTLAAGLTIVSFLFISHVLRKLGNYKLTVVFTLLNLVALIGMALSDSLRMSVPFFILHQTLVPLILFNLDVYMERFVGDQENETGSRHGLYLALMSFATAVGPLISGFLVAPDGSSFTLAYIASALLLLLFLLIVVRYFRTFSDAPYVGARAIDTLRSFMLSENLRNIFTAHFFLQLFFGWMVIYMPLYLAMVVGFSWQEIGVILFTAMMAYVILEYPIGIIADRYIGEKEMMVFGFILMGAATASFFYLTTASLGVWMLAAFISRVGASFVDTTTETYFFKHTNGSDVQNISIFRITRPLSYLVGALLGSFALLYTSLAGTFIVLSILLIPGLFAALQLEDTK